MKKLLAVLLILCVFCSSALAAGQLEVSESRVVRTCDDYGTYEINVFIQVTNTGDAAVSLDKADIYLTDETGAVLEDDTTYALYPPVLQPGEIGYITNWFYNVDAAIAEAVKGYSIDIASENDWLAEIVSVSHTAEYAEVESYDLLPVVTFTVTNTGADTVWNPVLVAIVRSTEGKILAMMDETAYNVGIPVGGTLLYEMELGSDDLTSWKDAGYIVGSVEVFVYSELY